jgi:hypothetical protein
MIDTPPHSFRNSNASPKVETLDKGVGVHSQAHNTSRVEGRAGAPGWGLKRVTSKSIIHMNLQKPNNKLINAWLEHFWCTDKPWAYTDSQNSSRPKLGGNHHLPPYSILFGSPKIFEIGTPTTLEGHNFLCILLIEVKYQSKL